MARSAEAAVPLGSREHGGASLPELEAFGLAVEDVLDLSQSVNPYGPCAAVAAAVRGAPLDRYPDATALPARRALGDALGVGAERIVVGNGAAELLWTLARAVLEPGDAVAIVEPTFSELRTAASSLRASIVEWRASAANGFAIDLDAVGEVVRQARAALVYVCTPNNPTGVAIPAADLAAFAAARPDVLVAIDEAFQSLGDRFADASLEMPPNVVRIRSLTKEQGIPGVRAGYALCSAALAARLEAARPPWTTGAAAQAAIAAGCAAGDFVAASRVRLCAERQRLAAALRALGLAVQSSAANFLLLRVGEGAALRRALLAHHKILVRDCASFGLPEFVRVAVSTPADGDRLLVALRGELARGEH